MGTNHAITYKILKLDKKAEKEIFGKLSHKTLKRQDKKNTKQGRFRGWTNLFRCLLKIGV